MAEIHLLIIVTKSFMLLPCLFKLNMHSAHLPEKNVATNFDILTLQIRQKYNLGHLRSKVYKVYIYKVYLLAWDMLPMP